MANSRCYLMIAASVLIASLLLAPRAAADDGPISDWMDLSYDDAPKAARPFISDDGSCVAYQEYYPKSGDPQRIVILNPASRKARQLQFDHEPEIALIGLSGDCKLIALQDRHGTDGRVYYLPASNPIGLPHRTTILPGARHIRRTLLSGDGNVIVYDNPVGGGLLLQRLAPGADLPVPLVKTENVFPNPALFSEKGDVLAFTTTAKVYGGAPEVPGKTGHNGGFNTVFVQMKGGVPSTYAVNRKSAGAAACDSILPVGWADDGGVAVRVQPQRCNTCKPPSGKFCPGSAGQPFPSASLVYPGTATTKLAFKIDGLTTNDPKEEAPLFMAVMPGSQKLIAAFVSRSETCLRIVSGLDVVSDCIAKYPFRAHPWAAVVSRDGKWLAFLIQQKVYLQQLPAQ